MLNNPSMGFKYQSAAQLLEQAVQYVGVLPEQLDDQKRIFAIYSLNEILKSWCNDKTIQFNIIHSMVKLQSNVPAYVLPKMIYQVLDCTRVISKRLTDGVASGLGGGNPSLAFDKDLNTACTQTLENGTIGLQFSTPQIVNYVGVLSNTTKEYFLNIEISNNGTDWISVYRMKRPDFFEGIKNESAIYWIKVITPQPSTYIRIREMGGAILDITELYFEQYQSSIYISDISQDSYDALSNKNTGGLPTTYTTLKENEQVIVTVWAVPDEQTLSYNNQSILMDFRCLQSPLDINYLKYPLAINENFLPALRKKLSYEISLAWKPEISALLKQEYLEEFRKSLATDSDGGNFVITLPYVTLD
jgi:hypothetical protein